MSDIEALTESHNLKQDERVIVKERFNSEISYRGIIYKIINKPLNERILHYKNTYIDYFYIKFDEPIYHLLLHLLTFQLPIYVTRNRQWRFLG